MTEPTFGTYKRAIPFEPVYVLAILPSGVIKSNLSCIPPNPYQLQSIINTDL
jgi:hypothetical protein